MAASFTEENASISKAASNLNLTPPNGLWWNLLAQAGAAGPSGAGGPTGPPVTFLGTWNSGTNYSAGDLVSYSNGNSYASLIANNQNQNPSTTPAAWGLLAQAGGAGPLGPSGPSGPTGPQGQIGRAACTG